MVLVIDAGAPTLFLDCQSFPHTEIVAVPFFRVATISIVWDGVGVKDRVGGTAHFLCPANNKFPYKVAATCLPLF